VSAYHAVKDPAGHRFLYQDYLWHGADLLGLGVASFGYLGGVHYQNEVTLESYQRRVEARNLPLQRAYSLSPRDRFVCEFIVPPPAIFRNHVSTFTFRNE
jgi:oxygen-independent coproporphyrinogen-3 oxidase